MHLNKNLVFFRNNYLSLYQKLIIHQSIQTESTKISRYHTIKIQEKYLYSKYDPMKESKNIIRSLSYKNQKNLIFLGFGFGYLLLPFIDLQDKNIWIFEKDINFFYESLHYINYPLFCQKNSVHFNIADLSDLPNVSELKKAFFIEHASLIDFHKNFYEKVHIKFKQILETSISDLTTMGYFTPIWFRNSLLNFKKINQSYSLLNLKNKFAKFSACLVAGGPNLENTITILKQYQDSVVIVAVATSVKRLADEGITPHFIISTDGGFYNSWHTRNFITDSLLVMDFSTHFLTTQKYKGKFAFINYDLGYTDFFFDSTKVIPKFKMESTVSATAIKFIQFLGIKNIYLFGQDFGFPDYKTHCKSTIYEYYGLLSQNKMHPYDTRDIDNIMAEQLEYTKNYDHESMRTSLKLKLYKQNFIQNQYFIYQTSEKAAYIDFVRLNKKIKKQPISAFSIIEQNLEKIQFDFDKELLFQKIKRYQNQLNDQDIESFLLSVDADLANGLKSYLEFDLIQNKNNINKIKQKVEKYLFFIEKIFKNLDKG